MYTVYKHTAPSGKIYVGITSQEVNKRWRNGKGYRGQVFYMAIKKYGWGNIKHEILYTNLNKEEAEEKEIYLIKKYRSSHKKFGYNVENGGNTAGTHSEETKMKISRAQKGRKITGTHLENMRRASKTRKKPYISKEKRIEINKKLSEIRKGDKNPMYGRIGEKCPMHYKTGAKNHYAKSIICVDTGEIFDCMEDAARKYNLSANLISKCCRGKQKTTGGLMFKYWISEDLKTKEIEGQCSMFGE